MHGTESRIHIILDTKYEKANLEKTITSPCHPLLVFENSKVLNLIRKKGFVQ